MYRTDSAQLGRCQYVRLTHPQYAAVLVVDVDQTGTTGGNPSNLSPYVRGVTRSLVEHGIGPAWVGVNPESGKAQMLWLIDPVYADEAGSSPQMKLLVATSRVLGGLLDGDPHFAHGFSRSPFYAGNAPEAYRWYPQHHRVMRLGDLVKHARDLAGVAPQETPQPKQQFASGRELIEAVKARREQAVQARELFKSLDKELADLDDLGVDRIDGVKVLWINQSRAARDETAFRHALATAHRLREAGQRMTDAKIIDAYERAYNVAQAVGADSREPEMPPMRDRLTMARRVRGYVLSGRSARTGAKLRASEGVGARERKALATMGRRGGLKAAERWKDRNSDYAQEEIKKLEKANQQRQTKGRVTAREIANYFDDVFVQTGEYPAVAMAMTECRASRSTVLRAIKKAGIELPRGRRKKGVTP
ncbi:MULTISPECIES: replication initiation protein [unclassified Corynebacterium]|uniref:replication initiation protein n=1 Tax=unclassified Corynebacterium TaxID=2624378 RepID=UPI0029CA4168|nr:MULTISPECIES: replication initiation protein [unclassified Corynebacterium]WPF67349.1 replication initiation protein [Corynebacterium sp. 22KM0430]WPF69828.1 replication initiation protein [Corynebacterium sp. 21KM1197]